MKYLYGIDIGGTTVKMGLFGEDGTLKEKWEIKTRTEENGKNILPDIAQAVNDHSKANGFDKEDVIGLGVGVPGAVLEFSKVNECVNLGWGSVDVAGELSKLTGCKVKATNDANAAALGEIWMGAAADYNSAVMITLGTGVGGGIIVDGKIIDGSPWIWWRDRSYDCGILLIIVYAIVERQVAWSFMHLQQELYMRQRKH